MDNSQNTPVTITPEMAAVLEHMRYDKEADAILIDCNLSCKIKETAGKSEDERHKG